jgi:hypothetical protein
MDASFHRRNELSLGLKPKGARATRQGQKEETRQDYSGYFAR